MSYRALCTIGLALSAAALISSSAYAGCPGAGGPGSLPPLSDESLTNSLRQAGFPEETLPTMVCLAGAESNKQPEAFCYDKPPSEKLLAFGVMQIYHIWYKDCTGYDDLDSQLSVLANPDANAACAYKAFRYAKHATTNGYTAWTTYNNGLCRGL